MIAFGLWKVRNIIVLLLLALTFAAAIRPGVEWLRRKKVPDGLSILVFFVLGLGVFVLFFWLALPPASHELRGVLLVLAVGAAAGEHQGVDPRAGAGRAHREQRATSADGDVVTVRTQQRQARRAGHSQPDHLSHRALVLSQEAYFSQSAHGRSPREYASSSAIRSLTVSVGRQ